jgi:hypothetical protein
MVANNKYLPYDITDNVYTLFFHYQLHTYNKMKFSVHITQKQGEFKRLKITECTLRY